WFPVIVSSVGRVVQGKFAAAMGNPPPADTTLDQRLQNAYKSTHQGRAPVKLVSGGGGKGRYTLRSPLRRRRRGKDALHTRGAPKTPGARASGRCASECGTQRCAKERLPCRFMRRAMSASTTRRPAPAPRCC